MNALQRRAAGYGLTALLCGGLVWAGFVHEADPDLLTMVSAVDVQLRLASVMPEKNKNGDAVKERADLLAAARGYLDRIDRVEPGYAPACEYRAFLAYLEKDYAGAATLYHRLGAIGGCSKDLADQAIINEARMLRMDGRNPEAAVLLREHGTGFLPEHREAAQRELAQASGTDAAQAGARTAGVTGGAGAAPAPAVPPAGTGRSK